MDNCCVGNLEHRVVILKEGAAAAVVVQEVASIGGGL